MFGIDNMQNYEQGTLKINPELANLSIEDLLATRDLAFGVQLVTTGYYNPFTQENQLSASHSVVRSDTFEELGGGFSDGYNPVSYIDGLEGVFGNLKKLGGIPTRLIKLDGGARAAIQFILPNDYWVAGVQHKLFAQLFMAHNGKQGILFNSSDVRIICGNTYAMAKASKELRYSVRHTKNVTKGLEEIQKALFVTEKSAELHYEFLNQAAQKYVDTAEIQQFIMAMVPKEGEEKTKAKENQRAELGAAIQLSASEVNNSRVSAYDLFNGITRINSYRWADGGRNEDEKFEYALNNSDRGLEAVNYIREIL